MLGRHYGPRLLIGEDSIGGRVFNSQSLVLMVLGLGRVLGLAVVIVLVVGLLLHYLTLLLFIWTLMILQNFMLLVFRIDVDYLFRVEVVFFAIAA